MIQEPDLHSFYEKEHPRMKHLSWSVTVDFEKRILRNVAALTFEKGGPVLLDTRDLSIQTITDNTGAVVPFSLGETHPIFGTPLSLIIPSDGTIRITYETSPNATGLQWLSKEQTTSKKYPFLFSQGEAIHARSYIPCQDSPGVRFTFDANITVPKELRGLIAAPEHKGRIENETTATENWSMPHPIPAYLLALAVGELAYQQLGEQTGIFAEPPLLEAAAREFEDLPAMLTAAEKLFGPYLWGHYNVLVMPYSFPYGGMENPCLSFVTPSLLAGDKSGASVVAHELAHSWTGNLITNETWRDFWLNEGWTVYAEDRISETVFGEDMTALSMKLLEKEYDRDAVYFASHPLFTALAPDMHNIDPDDVFSRVPYFMGAMFLKKMESVVGRDRFDAFIHDYIRTFSFSSITTARFLSFVAEKLPGVLEEVRAWEWVYEAGMPHDAPEITTPRIEEAAAFAKSGTLPPNSHNWNALAAQYFIELLPRNISRELLESIEKRFAVFSTQNAELHYSYLMLALESGMTQVYGEVETFLKKHGRVRYVKPLYKALTSSEEGHTFAKRVFNEARAGYHPITALQIERILAKK